MNPGSSLESCSIELRCSWRLDWVILGDIELRYLYPGLSLPAGSSLGNCPVQFLDADP